MASGNDDDLFSFFHELNTETDRGLPLVAAALIDNKLLETLYAFLCDGKAASRLLVENNAPLGTLSSRIEACSALGLIDDYEYQEISLIRKIRNEFAHAEHGISFETEKVRSLCASLRSDFPETPDVPINDPRFRFTNSVVNMVTRLYYRSTYVVQERRNPKTWVENQGWRLASVEKPPKGVPVIALVQKR